MKPVLWGGDHTGRFSIRVYGIHLFLMFLPTESLPGSVLSNWFGAKPSNRGHCDSRSQYSRSKQGAGDSTRASLFRGSLQERPTTNKVQNAVCRFAVYELLLYVAQFGNRTGAEEISPESDESLFCRL